MDARLLHAAADRKASESLASIPAMTGKPGRAFLDDLAHPMERFHVVLECRTAEQADLRDVRWTQSRLTAFALNRLDHRGLFTADVGTGAPAQVDRWNGA